MTYRPETLAVHAGQSSDQQTNSFGAPIYQTVAYEFEDAQQATDLFALRVPGNIYSRIANPSQDRFEQRINALEGGVGALATASGAAATSYAVLNLLTSGDNIVALSTLYGGTYALFAHTLSQYSIETRLIDPNHPERLADLVDDRTRLVFGEVLCNPALNVVDLDAWTASAHSFGLPFIADNTVTTPYLCRPFEHGVDVVVHSATKYLGGHGAAMGGVIVDSGNFDWAAHADQFPMMTQPDHSYHDVVWTDAGGAAAYIVRARTVLMRNMGATMSPFNAWLLAQSVESLHLRMRAHSANALAVASFLQQHPAVAWVNYPGLASDPYKAVADAQFTGQGYSGLVSFGLTAGRAAGARFIESLQLFSHVANIGDTRSMAIHNASTTHSQLNDAELAAAGVAPEMVRLSVGIENADDLITDLNQGLAAATSSK